MIEANMPLVVEPDYIIDGDTFKFTHEGTQYSSRARWIDCPEIQKEDQQSEDYLILKHWEYAQKAKDYLLQLIEGKKLVIVPHKLDGYGRWLCNWYLERIGINNNIQLRLATEGLATYHPELNHYDFKDNELFIYLQIIKRSVDSYKSGIGMWSIPGFITPYDFKRKNLNS